MPRVKFITTGHSHLAGSFSAGDTYTGDEVACRHFVEDARCAVWDEVQTSAAAPCADPSRAELDSLVNAPTSGVQEKTDAPPAGDAASPGAAEQAAEAPAPAPAAADQSIA
jgi:hypothetical protein